MKETWKPVAKYEGIYEASNLGRIRNCCTGRVLKQYVPSDGYVQISLQNKTFRVHRIILSAFEPSGKNKPHVNHKDGDKSNNALSNLEWVTLSQNNTHATRTGLMKNRTRLTANQVLEIRKIKGEYNQTEIAKMFSVGATTVRDIINGKSWTYV